jgi:hypothetical protein
MVAKVIKIKSEPSQLQNPNQNQSIDGCYRTTSRLIVGLIEAQLLMVTMATQIQNYRWLLGTFDLRW